MEIDRGSIPLAAADRVTLLAIPSSAPLWGDRIPMEANQISTQIAEGFFKTTNTFLAAALTTVGVEFKRHPSLPSISNVYDETRPFKRDARGRPLPGEVMYYLENQGVTMGVPFGNLILGWEEGRADTEFHEVLQQLVKECASNPKLSPLTIRLQKLFPAMLMAHARGIADNRNRISDLWRKCIPYLRFRRPNGTQRLISKPHYDRMTPEQKKEFVTR